MRWAWSSALLLVLASLAGCGGGSGSAGACGPDENLVESRGNFHVTDDDYAEYDSYPPTGGPHTQAEPEPGVHDDPIPVATQVTGLELKMVAINYSSEVDGGDVADLESLYRSYSNLIVAPAAAEIDEDAPIAVTAWNYRMLCDGVDLDAIEEFVEAHSGGAAEIG